MTMTFVPVAYSNGAQVQMAYTAGAATQLEWEGWWPVGEREPPIQLDQRFAFGPTPPESPRPGTIYFATPA